MASEGRRVNLSLCLSLSPGGDLSLTLSPRPLQALLALTPPSAQGGSPTPALLCPHQCPKPALHKLHPEACQHPAPTSTSPRSGLPTSFVPLPRPRPDCLGPSWDWGVALAPYLSLLKLQPHLWGPQGQCRALSAQTPAVCLLSNSHCGWCLLSSWVGWRG